jgi:hypothetical protein
MLLCFFLRAEESKRLLYEAGAGALTTNWTQETNICHLNMTFLKNSIIIWNISCIFAPEKRKNRF